MYELSISMIMVGKLGNFCVYEQIQEADDQGSCCRPVYIDSRKFDKDPPRYIDVKISVRAVPMPIEIDSNFKNSIIDGYEVYKNTLEDGYSI